MGQDTNVKLHLLAGAALSIICWALGEFAGVKLPAEVAMAGGTVLETILLWALPADLLKKGAASAALIFALLIPATAEASPARLVADCAQQDEHLSASTNQIEKVCTRPRVYFDIGVQFGGAAFKLSRPREQLVGFNAGSGYGFRWLPDFWTLSDSFIAIDLFVVAGFVSREEGDSLDLGLTAMLTFGNLVGGGFGYQWSLGFKGAPDAQTPIGVLGIVHSF